MSGFQSLAFLYDSLLIKLATSSVRIQVDHGPQDHGTIAQQVPVHPLVGNQLFLNVGCDLEVWFVMDGGSGGLGSLRSL